MQLAIFSAHVMLDGIPSNVVFEDNFDRVISAGV